MPSDTCPVIGITGGVACGKSTVSAHIADRLTVEHLDTDQLAKQFMNEDAETRASIISQISPLAYAKDGTLNRKWLRNAIFSDQTIRSTLNAIVHPKVRTYWLSKINDSRKSKTGLIVEIPLLYEVHAAEPFDLVVVVGASSAKQVERLTTKRGLSESLARKMLATQLDLSDKIALADRVIWNDSGLEPLKNQADYLSAQLFAFSTFRNS